MSITYAPLMATLHQRKMNRQAIQLALGLSSSTVAKLGRDEYISLKVIDQICSLLGCEIQDVVKHIKEEAPAERAQA